jgi:pyruvate, water dikinase
MITSRHIFFVLVLLSFSYRSFLYGQVSYKGYVYDAESSKPLDNAEIQISGTELKAYSNAQGQFAFQDNVIDSILQYNRQAIFSFQNNQIYWTSSGPVSVTLFDTRGRNMGGNVSGSVTQGIYTFPILPSGSFLLKLSGPRSNKTVKVVVVEGKVHLSLNELGLYESLQIQISVNGYPPKKFLLRSIPGSSYYLSKINASLFDYIQTIPTALVFKDYEGGPLNDTYNGVTAIKFFYNISTGEIYYANSWRYMYHYDFASAVLGYTKGLYFFNKEQYRHNPARIYYMGSINHYLSSDTYTMEFFAGDELTCNEINTLYEKIAGTCFFRDRLKFFPNTSGWENCSNIPIIKSDELFQGQDYQALNIGEAYGYLKKVEWTSLSSTYLGKHDIALINGIPNEVPVVSGIITTQFQTPLSHINILSKNRKTPNMALRSGWNNEFLNSLTGKLVKLEVALSYYSIREATPSEAARFWETQEPQKPVKLVADTITNGLIDLENTGLDGIQLIGGKAANYAELQKINGVQLPEGGFAIPFYYYNDHLKRNGIWKYIQQMLTNPDFIQNATVREEMLSRLRDTIKHAPINPELLFLVNQRLQRSGFQAYRFRSSTNAEDIEGFNGAGLYDSYTGIPGDEVKAIEKAIRKVWASLWNFRAYEERAFYKIDQLSVAMGILVHRSFPSEDANGVVITKNLYNSNLPAYTINCQYLEYSVVLPDPGILPEQIIYYTFDESSPNKIEYVNRSNLPGREHETVLTNDEIINLAKTCGLMVDHYCKVLNKCYPLDIEFKIDASVSGYRKLYIKQARPFRE